MREELTIYDIFLTPLFILFQVIYGGYIRNKYIDTNPEYRYFIPALVVRTSGAILVGLIYFFIYHGGDTVNYFQSATCTAKLLLRDAYGFWDFWNGDITNLRYMFNEETGYPIYKPTDSHAFFVVKLLVPLVTLGAYSYFCTAVLVSIITFSGVWRMYQTFIFEFPHLKKELAIACLFLPSCVFWGSGIMKDSFTLSAVGWFTYAFYFFFIKKHYRLKYVFYLLIAAYIIIAIKPYIFFALLPGSLLWLSNSLVKRLGSKTMQNLAMPILLAIAGFGGFVALDLMGGSLGAYSLDNVMEKAVITQQDMKSAHYGGKSFDIGDFDADATSMIQKAPMAIFSGIFRPALWDVKNFLMLISSLENTYLLLMTVFLLWKLKVIGFFGYINKNPLLVFSLLFSVFFAFSVGLTVANFGSLVRLRIPELPFYVSSILIMRGYYEQKTGSKLRF